MADDTDDSGFRVISRKSTDAAPDEDSGFRIISRAKKPLEPAQLQKPAPFTAGPQGDTLDPRDPKTRTSILQDLGTSPLTKEAMSASGEGVKQMGQPGAMNKIMGALGIATAPFKQAEAYLSDPAQVLAKKAGATPKEQSGLREWTDALVDVAPAILTGGATAAARAAAKGLATREVGMMAPERLDAAAKAAFEDAGKIGIKMKPGVYGKFLDTITPTLEKLNAQSEVKAFNPDAFPFTAKIRQTLERIPPDAKLSLKDVQALQTEINEFVRGALKASEGGKPGTDLKIAQTLSSQFRDFTDKVMETAPLNKARDLWSRKMKADDIKWFIDRAVTLRDPDYLPQQMRNIALNPIEFKRYTPQEQKLIEQIAGGSATGDIAHAATSGHRMGIAGRAGKAAVTALRGVDTKKADELVKLIARGKGAQAVSTMSPGSPSFVDRMGALLNP